MNDAPCWPNMTSNMIIWSHISPYMKGKFTKNKQTENRTIIKYM